MMNDVIGLLIAIVMISATVALIPPRTSSNDRFAAITSATKTDSSSKSADLISEGSVVGDADIALLEKSTRIINAFAKREQKRGKKRPIRSKRFRFTTSVSASTTIKETKDTSLTLDKYMSLPIDKYNLLDERFLSRTKDGFQFTLPLGEIKTQKGEKLFSGLSGVRAQCNLGVQSDTDKQKNTITASSFKIVVEKDDLNEAKARSEDDKKRLSIIREQMIKQANITSSGQAFGNPLLVRENNTIEQGENSSSTIVQLQEEIEQSEQRGREIQQSLSTLTTEERTELNQASMRSILTALDGVALEADGTVVLSWGKSGGRFTNLLSSAEPMYTAEDNILRPIDAKLALDAQITLPLPLPRILVNPIGSLILRISFGQVLPRLLHIIGRDYERRSGGENTTFEGKDHIGSFL